MNFSYGRIRKINHSKTSLGGNDKRCKGIFFSFLKAEIMFQEFKLHPK